MTTVAHGLQKFIRLFPVVRSIANALRSESFASWSLVIPHTLRGKWQAEGFCGCHPERSEGSRGEILRCAQNDIIKWLLRKVYELSASRFGFSGRISDTARRELQQWLSGTTQGIRHALRGESVDWETKKLRFA